MNSRRITALIVICLPVTMILSVLLGSVSFSAEDFHLALTDPESKQAFILFSLRLPRTAAACAAGMGLAVAGAVIQTIFQNPLAGPNIIGVNAGASFFVILAGILFPTSYYFIPIAAFFGAFLTAGLVFLLGQKAGFSKTSIILAGIAVNSLFNSASDLICSLNDSFIVSNKTFRMGSLATIHLRVLIPAVILIVTGLLVLLCFTNELEVLSLGKDTASALGLPVGRYRLFFLAAAALLAGAVISFAGPIGFVGLVVPHLIRLLHLNTTRGYLLLSGLSGALLVCACDLLARILFRPHELPVGILLSFIGVPFFIWLLIKRRQTRN